MPGWKTFLIALLSGIAMALFLGAFWRWPVAIVGGVGVLTAAVVLLTSVSIGTDPAEADAAWRRSAPDLVDPPAGPVTADSSESVRPSRREGGEPLLAERIEPARGGLVGIRRPAPIPAEQDAQQREQRQDPEA